VSSASPDWALGGGCDELSHALDERRDGRVLRQPLEGFSALILRVVGHGRAVEAAVDRGGHEAWRAGIDGACRLQEQIDERALLLGRALMTVIRVTSRWL